PLTAPAPTHIYTLSLHDALPISQRRAALLGTPAPGIAKPEGRQHVDRGSLGPAVRHLDADAEIFHVRLGVLDEDVEVPVLVEDRSEEHTSELQSQSNLVCRLLLE